MLAQFPVDDDSRCQAISDADLFALMTGDIIEMPVEVEEVIFSQAARRSQAISDTEWMTLMNEDIIELSVESESELVDDHPQERPASTEGEDAIARVLHYLRFYQPNKVLFKEVHEMVINCFEKGVATNSLDDFPGIVFENFVAIMGQAFLPIFEVSTQFDMETVLRVKW